jgi:hypothetical protein
MNSWFCPTGNPVAYFVLTPTCTTHSKGSSSFPSFPAALFLSPHTHQNNTSQQSSTQHRSRVPPSNSGPEAKHNIKTRHRCSPKSALLFSFRRRLTPSPSPSQEYNRLSRGEHYFHVTLFRYIYFDRSSRRINNSPLES